MPARNACARIAKVKDPRFAEHLSVLVDVVRAGSFSGAARRRNVTPSAIVRQIDALEAGLGAAVFVRSTRALALTDAGRLVFERAQPILDELVDLRAEVLGLEDAVTGTLRLACFPTFGKRYVIPIAHALMEQHPDFSIELDLTERLADPVLERLDAVIRIGHLADSTLISSKIASDRRLLVAQPAYLAQYGIPARNEIGAYRLIDKLHGPDLLGWRHVLGCTTAQLPSSRTVFRCDDFEALRQAALRGMGIALLPEWVIGPDVRAGLLQKLPHDVRPPEGDAGIYVLRALPKASARLAAFMAALRAHIGAPPVWAHDHQPTEAQLAAVPSFVPTPAMLELPTTV
nr:LysR family transcriptional regulator [Novosphingobium sp. SG751A]